MKHRDVGYTLCLQPDWKVTMLAVILLPCLLSLGFWQLSRAEEKQVLKAVFEQRKTLDPVSVATLLQERDLRYRQVSLRGEYLNDKVLLLDNKIYRGQFGYEVISPFMLADDELIVLVNRGWISADISRRTLPDIDSVEGEVELIGEIYVPQGEIMTLGQQNDTGWPRVIQSLSISNLAAQFDKEVFPFSVRLSAVAEGAYQPNWVVVNIQPEKHTAYAFQWFAMAGTLVIIVLLANTNLWQLLKQRRK